jgi:putative transposase
MDGKGRTTDNAFIETLWKSVKYEKVYLEPAENGHDLHQKLKQYFSYYNQERRHTSIENITPKEKYFSTRQPRHKVRAAL